MQTTRRSRSSALVCAAACMSVAAALVNPGGDGEQARAAGAPYVVDVPGGGFETPVLVGGTRQQNPEATPWYYSDVAGVSTGGSSITVGAPPVPQGRQVAYIRNSSKIVQQMWVEPGDQLRFSATQTKALRTGLQVLRVALDGVVQGSATPGDGKWTTHTIALNVTAPSRVTVELRGLPLLDPEVRVALVDDVQILRVPADIPNGGLPARSQRSIMDPRPLVLGAGVVGIRTEGDTEFLVETPVQAFAQSGSRVFVGGKFASVQPGDGAALVDQSYLAAFDKSSGAWISSFRPQFDGTVWDMVVVDGKLIVAGQFTTVNGQPSTAGLVALDPQTGDVVPGWTATIASTTGTTRPLARALDVQGAWIVVGGRFNRITGPTGPAVAVNNLARIAVGTGAPAAAFTPVINGQVYDVDATTQRVYAVGKFSVVNGENRRALAILNFSDGASVPGMKQMLFSSDETRFQYSQSVLADGNVLWVGGSQHHTQLYTTTDLTRLRSYVTSPQGDIQAMVASNGFLYAASHANPRTFHYTNATQWITLDGWTTRDPVRWIAVIDRTTRNFVPTWLPAIGMHNGEGIWDMFVDSDGCLWAGGDVKRGAYVGTTPNYAEGFVKFCGVDSTSPTPPTNVSTVLASGGVKVTWAAGSDDRSGGLRYDVFRNDRMVAQSEALRTYVDAGGKPGDRYFVRTRDLAGNLSATTSVVVAPADVTAPKTPKDLAVTVSGRSVTLTWTAPTDDVGVVGYWIYDNPNKIAESTATSVTITGLTVGKHSFAVRAIDAAGNTSLKTAPVDVTIS